MRDKATAVTQLGAITAIWEGGGEGMGPMALHAPDARAN